MIGFFFPLPYLAIARNPVESYASRTRQLAVGLFRCERSVAKERAYEKDSGFNLAVIVFTRRSINDTLAICRYAVVNFTTASSGSERRSRYRSYYSALTREKQRLLIGCRMYIDIHPGYCGGEPV